MTFTTRTTTIFTAVVMTAISFGSPVAADSVPEIAKAREYARGLSLAFQTVARELEPSVVNIRSTRTVAALPHHRQIPFGLGDGLFDRFFRFDAPRNAPGRNFEHHGIGTGVIVREDGYILTNSHVIDGADSVQVTLSTGETLEAEIVGRDQKTDVAVLRVDRDGLTPARLGNSDTVQVGQWVVAIGSPFGLAQTCTTGIISAKGRANVGVADYEDFLQTDAAINPGNSGGPLADLDGNLLGINTAIVSRSGGFMGVGLAIPINMARGVMESLIDGGVVRRGWLGVAIQDLDPGLAKSFSFDGTKGVLIGDVTDDSPAAKAGLRTGDIITRFNGRTTETMNQLRNVVAAAKPGSRVPVEVFRDGKSKSLLVEIGELAGSAGTAMTSELGLSVQSPTREFSSKTGYSGTAGVVVTQVQPGGLASRAGLRVDDVILSVNNEEISTEAAFLAAVNKADLGAGLRLRVWSGGMHRFVFVKKR